MFFNPRLTNYDSDGFNFKEFIEIINSKLPNVSKVALGEFFYHKYCNYMTVTILKDNKLSDEDRHKAIEELRHFARDKKLNLSVVYVVNEADIKETFSPIVELTKEKQAKLNN